MAEPGSFDDGTDIRYRDSWAGPSPELTHELIRHGDEDDAGVEEQQPLEIERTLVVERAAQPADDQLRHHDDDFGAPVVAEAVEGRPKGRAGVAVGRAGDVERDPAPPRGPLARDRLPFFTLKAKWTARVSSIRSVWA